MGGSVGTAPVQHLEPSNPVTPGGGFVFVPVVVPPLGEASPDGGTASGVDAGIADAGSPPLVARPVVAEGSASDLERVGVDGGQPRLGTCREGVVIGVRPTANPTEATFGQRLTFIEPICGKVYRGPANEADPSGASITLIPDDSILNWDATGTFQGLPPTQVPDPRVTWVVQPATRCPETAPVLVGLSGEYDPVAPDDTETSAIRSLVIECAPLVVATDGVEVSAADSGHQLILQADSFTASGEVAYHSFCEGGSVVTQIQISAGFWLDGFVLGCSSLRSP